MNSNELQDLEQHRGWITKMAAFGCSDQEISLSTGLSLEEVRTIFLRELECAPINTNLAVAESFYEMATKGKSVTAATFWLRCRNGWVVKTASDISDKDEMILDFSKALDGNSEDDD